MASEKVKLFGAVELEYSSTSQGTLRVLSDVPGNAMTQRETATTPIASTRRQIRFRLSGTVKGHMLQLSWNPGAGLSRLYRVRVWARELPTGAWGWYPVYVPETSDEWQPVQLPVPQTPEEWSAIQLPIPPTPDAWSAIDLPIPATSMEWTPMQLPVKPTPAVPEWVSVGVDR
jgi:hypothetical protein